MALNPGDGPKGLDDQPEIGGVTVPLTGKLSRMLGDVFERSGRECNIEIAFVPAEDGQQQNECRTEIVGLLESNTIVRARKLAERLQRTTDGRSRLGLLFLVIGEQEEGKKKILLARFPADFGVLAEEDRNSLRVQFLERVFMKHALSYKAAIFSGRSFHSDFWDGYVVDRQLSTSASYWIKDFLLSDFKTTPAAGTRRLAQAISEAAKATLDVDVRTEILAAARLARNLDGQPITAEKFSERFNLSASAQDAILRELRHDTIRDASFQFCVQEFEKTLPFRSIELSNSAILTGPTSRFDELFQRQQVSGSQSIRFTTEGEIINDGFRKRK